ncbi:hypothetical protein VTI74DRAFT_440 [Chaetomium olivicolor]
MTLFDNRSSYCLRDQILQLLPTPRGCWLGGIRPSISLAHRRYRSPQQDAIRARRTEPQLQPFCGMKREQIPLKISGPSSPTPPIKYRRRDGSIGGWLQHGVASPLPRVEARSVKHFAKRRRETSDVVSPQDYPSPKACAQHLGSLPFVTHREQETRVPSQPRHFGSCWSWVAASVFSHCPAENNVITRARLTEQSTAVN